MPLSALADTGLKSILEKGFGKPLPGYRTLGTNYANWSYENLFTQVKEQLRKAVFYVIFDEADYHGDISKNDPHYLLQPYVSTTCRLSIYKVAISNREEAGTDKDYCPV